MDLTDVSIQSAVILSLVTERYVTFQGLMLAVKWHLKMQSLSPLHQSFLMRYKSWFSSMSTMMDAAS